MNFILASTSPRRKKILKKINLKFKIIDSKVDESIILKNIKPNQYCLKLAELKAKNISIKNPNSTVIGADTIVSINNQILNKPKNSNEAKEMLALLSNKKHKVITGVSLKNQDLNIDKSFYDTTLVTFYKLSQKQINYYIDHYSPFDKSGAYAIQDYGALFVKKIEGSYNNIVGFPIEKFYQVLKKYFKKNIFTI